MTLLVDAIQKGVATKMYFGITCFKVDSNLFEDLTLKHECFVSPGGKVFINGAYKRGNRSRNEINSPVGHLLTCLNKDGRIVCIIFS